MKLERIILLPASCFYHRPLVSITLSSNIQIHVISCKNYHSARRARSIVCLVGFLTPSSSTRLYHGRIPRLTSDNFTCCHTETKRGDHDFCLSQSHYTDTYPTSREWAATAGIKPGTSLPTELPPPPSTGRVVTVRLLSEN